MKTIFTLERNLNKKVKIRLGHSNIDMISSNKNMQFHLCFKKEIKQVFAIYWIFHVTHPQTKGKIILYSQSKRDECINRIRVWL
jgi:hypothetical protein